MSRFDQRRELFRIGLRTRRPAVLCFSRPKLGVKGLLMAEIFLNALVIAYAIYHTAVSFGWALLLFDISHQSEEQNGCAESPGIPFFVHGVSTTSALGLVLWIFGYMIDFNSRNMVEQKKEESLGDTTDSPPQAATIAAVVLSAAAAETSSSSPTIEGTSNNDSTPLIEKDSERKFEFAFNHLTCLGIGFLHIAWVGFGSAVTFPMFFRLKLYNNGLETSACNAAMYWFAFLTVILQYLLLSTLFVWFTIDVVFCWGKNSIIIDKSLPDAKRDKNGTP